MVAEPLSIRRVAVAAYAPADSLIWAGMTRSPKPLTVQSNLAMQEKDASIVAYTKDSKLKGVSREKAPTRPNCPTSSCKAEVGRAHLSSGLGQST